jgi:catechol 2,3-dioxygenase-like lactoylglutathione lyase family enzyme
MSVRRIASALLLLAVGLLPAPAGAERALVRAVDAVGLTVSDVERSRRFYADVLAFEPVSDVTVGGEPYARLQGIAELRMRVVRMRLGDEAIELTEYLTPRGRPAPAGSRSNDQWFQHVAIVVRDMDRAYDRLRAHGVAHVSPGPQRLPDWNRQAGGIEAFYFADPDGHPLELIAFPRGKGDPKWHRPTERLFLGVDHTAIVVGDGEASLRLYRDVLGFRVTGESRNHGPEQERLNAVRGARLRIIGLRAASGPGIELLEYLAPRDGRALPPDARANDLLHRQTRLVAQDEQSAERLGRAPVRFVSPGAVAVPARDLGFTRASLVRDPDGHALEVVEDR